VKGRKVESSGQSNEVPHPRLNFPCSVKSSQVKSSENVGKLDSNVIKFTSHGLSNCYNSTFSIPCFVPSTPQSFHFQSELVYLLIANSTQSLICSSPLFPPLQFLVNKTPQQQHYNSPQCHEHHHPLPSLPEVQHFIKSKSLFVPPSLPPLVPCSPPTYPAPLPWSKIASSLRLPSHRKASAPNRPIRPPKKLKAISRMLRLRN